MKDTISSHPSRKRNLQLETEFADDLVEDRFFRDEIRLVLHQVGPRLAELDRVAHFGRAAILHRQRVDSGLECLSEGARGLDFRKVSQYIEVFEIDRFDRIARFR